MGFMKNLAISLQEQSEAENLERGYFNELPTHGDIYCDCCGAWLDNKPNEYEGKKFCSNLCLEQYLKYAHYDEANRVEEPQPQWDDIAEDDDRNSEGICMWCHTSRIFYTHVTRQANVLQACSKKCLDLLISEDEEENLRYDDERNDDEPVSENSF